MRCEQLQSRNPFRFTFCQAVVTVFFHIQLSFYLLHTIRCLQNNKEKQAIDKSQTPSHSTESPTSISSSDTSNTDFIGLNISSLECHSPKHLCNLHHRSICALPRMQRNVFHSRFCPWSRKTSPSTLHNMQILIYMHSIRFFRLFSRACIIIVHFVRPFSYGKRCESILNYGIGTLTLFTDLLLLFFSQLFSNKFRCHTRVH